MNRMMLAIAAALCLCAGQAGAQSAEPVPASTFRIAPPTQKVHGIVAAVTDKGMALTEDDGTGATIDFLGNQSITLIAPATFDQIQAGSQVTTVDKTEADGTDVALSISILAPSAQHHDISRPMGSGLIWTSGSVTTVGSPNRIRSVTVDYGSGTRQFNVLDLTRITANTPCDRDQIRPGAKVYVTTRPPGETFPGQQTIVIFTGGL
jgi:hypothetical protein